MPRNWLNATQSPTTPAGMRSRLIGPRESLVVHSAPRSATQRAGTTAKKVPSESTEP